MYLPLFFIVPAVIALVCAVFLLSIRFGVPRWLRGTGFTAQLGGLRLDDIRDLPQQERALLSRVIAGYLVSAAGITVITSLVLVLQGHGDSGAMAMLCNGVELAAVLLMLRPVGKVAKSIQKRK